jgi:cytochrome c oxidase subunit 2
MQNFIFPAVIGLLCLTSFILILIAQQYLRRLYRKPEKGKNLERKFIHSQPYLLLFFIISLVLCVTLSTAHYAHKFLLHPLAIPHRDITSLFNTTTVLTAVAFFVTQILLFVFAFRYRSTASRRAKFTEGNLKLELVWTLIPAITFIFLFLWGQVIWRKLITAPEEALEIEVVAEQFVWRIRYPGMDKKLGRAGFHWISMNNPMGVDESDPLSKDDFIPIQMHIPKNKPIKISLRSKDVIHSFYIPHFHAKMDAVPGMLTYLHFTATTSTDEMRALLHDPEFDYEIGCAELCGRMHFAMKFILVVDEPEAFDSWFKNQKHWISEVF